MQTTEDLQKGVSVVIPVYNSAQILPHLLDRLHAVLDTLAQPFEVVLVDDGSRDESWEVIRKFAEIHPWVRGITLRRNFGQHNALLAGIRHARMSICITMDDDLQNPPEEIPALLARHAEGYDVVYGKPAVEQHGLLRDLASILTKRALQDFMGVENARHVSPFRAFSTAIRDAFRDFRGPFVALDVLLTWGASKYGHVVVAHEKRLAGVSQYSLRKLVTLALNLMTGFSVWPLQVASFIGLTLTLFGIAVFMYVVGRFIIQGTSVAGFPFLASIIAIFSGAQLFSLGIIGEYISRMHFRIMDKPTYVVGEATTGVSPTDRNS